MLIDFIKKVWDWILAFFGKIHEFAGWLADGIVYICLSVVFTIFKMFLSLVLSILTLLSCGSVDCNNVSVNIGSGWGLLSSQFGYFIGMIGLDIGLSMIIFAICIRFLLNLIPGAITRV